MRDAKRKRTVVEFPAAKPATVALGRVEQQTDISLRHAAVPQRGVGCHMWETMIRST